MSEKWIVERNGEDIEFDSKTDALAACGPDDLVCRAIMDFSSGDGRWKIVQVLDAKGSDPDAKREAREGYYADNPEEKIMQQMGIKAKRAADDVFRLSRAFSKQVLEAAEKYHPGSTAELIELTQEETDESICHSHDYCDANEAMLIAFEEIFGRELCLSWETGATTEGDTCTMEQVEADMEQVNAAWDLAKKNLFWVNDDSEARPDEPPTAYSDEDKKTLKSWGIQGRWKRRAKTENVPVATNGPSAEKGDTKDNAKEYLSKNKEKLDGGNVADAEKLLESGNYSRETVSETIKDTFGATAETTLSKPVKSSDFDEETAEDVIDVSAASGRTIVINVSAASKMAGSFDAEWEIKFEKAKDPDGLRAWWDGLLKLPDAKGDSNGYGGLPPAIQIHPTEVETYREAKNLALDKAEKWDYSYAVRCKEKQAWIVCAWIPE